MKIKLDPPDAFRAFKEKELVLFGSDDQQRLYKIEHTDPKTGVITLEEPIVYDHLGPSPAEEKSR